MRPTAPVVSFLFLLLLTTKAQGIHMEESSLSSFHRKIMEKWSLMVEGRGTGGVVLCRDENCSGGGRKLMTKAMSISKSQKIQEAKELIGAQRHHSRDKVDSIQGKFYVKPIGFEHKQLSETNSDIMDLAGMDYSPVKRNPPIHN